MRIWRTALWQVNSFVHHDCMMQSSPSVRWGTATQHFVIHLCFVQHQNVIKESPPPPSLLEMGTVQHTHGILIVFQHVRNPLFTDLLSQMFFKDAKYLLARFHSVVIAVCEMLLVYLSTACTCSICAASVTVAGTPLQWHLLLLPAQH